MSAGLSFAPRKVRTRVRCSNLVRGLQNEIDDDQNAAPVSQPLKDRAERILKDMEERKTRGLAAMDLLAALAAQKDAAAKAAKETGWRMSPSRAIGLRRCLG
jgi:type I restriction enzyme R subunit